MNMPDKNEDLYFIALVIDGEVGENITRIKEEVAEKYGSKRALNSPPHITIVPPFRMDRDSLDRKLAPVLFELAARRESFEIKLDGFSAFKPRVIFVHPVDHPELSGLQSNVIEVLSHRFSEIDAPDRPFHAHVTIAFRDLTQSAFYKAWPQFEKRHFTASYLCTDITILKHEEGKWVPYIDCPFGISTGIDHENTSSRR